ncbi:hypothetical protein ES703_28364 [subsurface metagenome]
MLHSGRIGLRCELTGERAIWTTTHNLYTPMDLANKSLEMIRADMKRVAREYAPCDVVVGDIEAGTADERVLAFLELCGEINLGIGSQ